MAAVSNQAPGQLDQNFGGDALTLKPESYMSMVWRRFRRHKLAMAGLCFLLLMYLVAVFAPYIATQSYRHTDPPNRLQAPSQEHWMGTDNIKDLSPGDMGKPDKHRLDLWQV